MCINGMNLCRLFPKRQGLLIGLAAAYISVASMIPQGWLMLIKSGTLSLSFLMYLWMGLAVVGLVISTILFPWHVVTNHKE